MLRGLPFVFVSLLIVITSMGLVEYSDEEQNKKAGRVLLVTGMSLYMLFFAISFSSVCWTINSEIFPIHLLGTATGIIAANHWLWAFVTGAIFLTCLETKEGKIITFCVLALFVVASWIFVYFLVPETLGKKINENV